MYTGFYGLREKPFSLAPDPRYLFLSASHREALAHLLYGIEEGEGFIEVIGQVGTGKTTLCRTLLDRIGSDAEIAALYQPERPIVRRAEGNQPVTAWLGELEQAVRGEDAVDAAKVGWLLTHDPFTR